MVLNRFNIPNINFLNFQNFLKRKKISRKLFVFNENFKSNKSIECNKGKSIFLIFVKQNVVCNSEFIKFKRTFMKQYLRLNNEQKEKDPESKENFQ